MSLREEEFGFRAPDGARLAGTLTLPEGRGPFPALLLASGSGAQDRDETILGHPVFATIARFFAARGVASLRFDDRGVGASEGVAEGSSFAEEVADLGAALEALAARPEIDQGRIRLLGHSQGGLTAAALAAREGVAVEAVAALAAPAEPIAGLIHRQAEQAGREAGYAPGALRHQREVDEAAFARARRGGDPALMTAETAEILLDGLLRWPGPPLGPPEALAETAAQMAAIICAPSYVGLLGVDAAALWRGLRRPLIAFFGGRDKQVPGFVNLRALRAALPPETPLKARVFPRANHLFQEAETGSPTEYERLGQAPAPEVLEALARGFAELSGR